MPPKKKVKETADEADEEELPKNVAKNSKPSAEDNSSNENSSIESKSSKEADPTENSGQLFFSTDGSDVEKKEENIFDDVGKGKPDDKDDVKASPVGSIETPVSDIDSKSKGQGPKPKHNHNHSNPQGHGNKNFKKPNWQDKKNPKNKPRPKFKKPKKLPYEDTESKPLELGSLLEFEDLKSEDGLSALAEVFVASDHQPISFNELYELALPELKEKVGSLSLDIDMPPAPIREEIFDLLFESCLKESFPLQVSAILCSLAESSLLHV